MEVVKAKTNGIIVSTDKEIEKEFEDALKSFLNSPIEGDEYSKYTPIGDEVLIRLFRFSASDKIGANLGSEMILTQSPLDGSWKPSKVSSSEKVFPLVKIIRVGLGVTKDLKEGDICTVPPEDVYGKTWNPDFLHLANTFAGKGGGAQGKLLNIPADMPQQIPSMEKNWSSYKFMKADVLGEVDEFDKLTFLVPTIKLKTLYKK